MVIFFTYKRWNFVSWLIRIITGQPYSHVAAYILKEKAVFDSTAEGIQSHRLQTFLRKNLVHKAIAVTLPLDKQLPGRLWPEQRLGYDYGAILWFLLYLTLARFRIRLPRFVINPRSYICSEYVYYLLTGETKTLTPREVEEWLQANNN